MRHLLLVMCITLALAAFDEVAATGFSNPLAAMTVVQPFGGSGGTHIGTDLDGTAGDAIYAIADGQVCFYDGSATAYGGGSGNCARDGAVLFVRHRKSNGDYFIAQYGHIQNVSSAFQQITTYTENGPSVSQGQKIAEIGVYTPKRDCSLGRADHLHFGIWDSNNSIPMNSWGYSSDPCWTNPQGCWFDPMTFLVNENPYMFYSCEFTSQSISPVGPYGPGQLVTCQVRYRNTGSSTWHNDPIVHPESYVELASTNEAGVPSESFFNFPPDAPDPDVNWKTDIVPCTMQETSVAPGAIATFNFQGRVNLNATPGNHKIYFGPTHNGTVLPGWGEMHYPIVVSAGWVATVPTNDCSGPVDGALQWHQPDFTPRYGPWRAVAVPDAGWGCDGCDRFYRFWYEYPGTASGLGASLEFHADNAITLYVNGQFVGEWGSGCHTDACVNPPYNCSVNYHAPDADITSYLHQGSNLIAAHVSDGGGIEYFSLSVNEHPLLIMEKAICCLGGNTCLPITPGYTSANCQQDNGQLYIGGWLDCGQFSSCNNRQQKI